RRESAVHHRGVQAGLVDPRQLRNSATPNSPTNSPTSNFQKLGKPRTNSQFLGVGHWAFIGRWELCRWELSRSPLDDPPRDARKMAVGKFLERRKRPLGALVGHAPRLREAVQRGIRRLAGGGILAGRLPEIRRRAGDVEDVVDDLKRETELGRESLDR